MATDKTRAQLKKELDELKNSNERFITIANITGTVIVNAMRLGVMAYAIYGITVVAESLAGLQTDANIVIRMLGNATINNSLAYVLAGGGLLWGYRERKLRQGTVGHVHAHTKQIEKQIDPGRSSSSLTETGQTNPDDAGEFGKE